MGQPSAEYWKQALDIGNVLTVNYDHQNCISHTNRILYYDKFTILYSVNNLNAPFVIIHDRQEVALRGKASSCKVFYLSFNEIYKCCHIYIDKSIYINNNKNEAIHT